MELQNSKEKRDEKIIIKIRMNILIKIYRIMCETIKENSLSVLLTVVRPLPGTWEQSKFSSLINNDTPLLAMKSRYHLRLISFCFLILWNCTYFFSFSYHCFLLSCYHVTCVRVQNDDQSKQRGGNIKGRV